MSIPGLLGALVGIALGLVGLLVLPWTSNGGADESYRDLREVVDVSGLPIGTLASGFVLTGAIFAVGVGGTVALARALGRRPLRALAAVVVALGAAGLAVAGFVAIDVDVASLAIEAESELGAQVGAPVTLPDGTPVTDPTTGEAVTVAEEGAGAEALTDDQVAAATMALGEDHLTDAAIVGGGLLAVAAALLLVGLGLRRRVGHVVTAGGLLVVAGWAIATVLQIRSSGLADPGLGAYAVAASAVLLAVSAAIPGPQQPDPAAGRPGDPADGAEPEPTVVL